MNYKIEVNGNNSRVLASLGKKCPLGCIYCFVENDGYQGLEKIDKDVNFEVLKQVAKGVDIIQPSCDTEFFLVPKAMEVLVELAKLGKTISFATKFRITEKIASQLSTINKQLSKNGAILQIAVSISRLKYWKEIELHAPSPSERIKTLKLLYKNGIPTTVAIRPLLPFTPEKELTELIDCTQEYCYGYISGPVYMTPALKSYMHEKNLQANTELRTVTWMKNNPQVETIHSRHLEETLKSRASIYNKFVFEDNVAAVTAIIKRNYVDNK